MIEYLPFIIQFIVFFVGAFWINRSLVEKGIGIKNKIRWLWFLGLFFAWYFLTIIGVILVLVVHYIWSREIYKS